MSNALIAEGSSGQKRKRPVGETVDETSTKERNPYSPHQTIDGDPEICIPDGIDIEDSYSLFSLFFTEELTEKIAAATNAHAACCLSKIKDVKSPRYWKDTNATEIKVLLGILVYMGVHQSPRVADYWRDNELEGPLHPPRLYMSMTRFEQLKRFVNVSNSDEDILKEVGSETSTNAAMTRPVFGDALKKILETPTFKNDYDHNMNGVDLASQHRSFYEMHSQGHQNRLPLLHYFIDAAIANAHRIQRLRKQQNEQPAASLTMFRGRLCQQLFDFASPVRISQPAQDFVPPNLHHRIPLPTRRGCVLCLYKKKRKQLQYSAPGKPTSGCLECGEKPLCLKNRCWEEWHALLH